MKQGERLLEFIHSTGMNITEFAKHIDVNVTTLHHIVSEKGRQNDPSPDTINKIIAKYPDFDPKWLLTGKKSIEATSETDLAAKWKRLADHYKKLADKYAEIIAERGISLD
jgi:plasmid maintenance system antidote protein VapI